MLVYSEKNQRKPGYGIYLLLLLSLVVMAFVPGCKEKKAEKIRVIFDTDTNNELDDQHALAYLLLNEPVFEVEAVTVNATRSGGGIEEQYAEAKRVIKLCDKLGRFPLLKGADRSFQEIYGQVNEEYFDGKDAVDYIIKRALAPDDRELVVIAVGKLTNIALALEKSPETGKKMKLVWLGSNYPDPGEYNQENDIEAMNFILSADVPLEIALVRYGKDNGTDAVRMTLKEIRENMPGKGPENLTGVTGRNGGEFHFFGDYSVDLFEHIDLHGDDQSRALFDMAATATVKNPAWSKTREIPAPVYENNQWHEQPGNPRTVTIRECFDRDAIIRDFLTTMEKATPK